MKFCWTTLPVNNFEESLDFYHGFLGLPINSKIKTDEMEMAMLGEENEPKIEIIYFPENKSKNFSSNITVGISIKSMDEMISILNEKNIKILRGPISPNLNIQFIFIKDPNGYEVQLVESK